ncbi:hypothetical protein BJF93_05490 [Xaviernesmea oryzae]|uniref:AB hydrolase-1 domain-containing protein n=1 Tax=Xaviernesmea oryzae TaxID=464029 RepID=A0A1Q9ARN7_9HYPH|nr:alpha/beta hydrolase [Xaviernesmea oryzae]OLP58087.1 hypothetical protein BJF93_05490 [Xaviernesmea oryzae]SEL83221.1 Pimeloyl-ACP methyl ester carboxylesterase [Xaviernesmea oryzae]
MLRSPDAVWLSDNPGTNTVLIHGMVMAPAFWRCFAPTIAMTGRAAAYPLPGHSPWILGNGHAPLTTAAIVDAYATAIERDFDGRPVTLVGHSTGGFISLLIARHRPDLVSRVVLMGAFACGRFEGQERMASRILRMPLLGRLLFSKLFTRWIATKETFRWGSLECVFDKAVAWETEETLATMEMVREHLLASRPHEIAAFVMWMTRTSIVPELPRIDVPVLNIIGAGDRVVPPVHQIHLAAALPRCHTVILNAIGHLPMAEARPTVDRLISDFILLGPHGLTSRAAAQKIRSGAAKGVLSTENRPKGTNITAMRY